MPELPEVETMVRGLRPVLEGTRLIRARIVTPAILEGSSPRQFAAAVRGKEVSGVRRRGKWVVLELDAGRMSIVIQPRMTGGFWLVPPPRPEHVRLIFENGGSGGTVWFSDARRLGRVALYRNPSAAEAAIARSQGPDALEITVGDFAARMSRTGRAIKPTLMDQKVLAGIGNIYADEVLHRARLHPLRPANRLSQGEVARLHEAIGPVLREAIAAEGSSFDAGYRTVLGLEGGFLAVNAMYGRGGEPCPGCGGPVSKAYLPGLLSRPSHFCPTCQPGPVVEAVDPSRLRRRPRGSPGRSGGDEVD